MIRSPSGRGQGEPQPVKFSSWGNLEYGCKVEEEILEFNLSLQYSQDTPPEIETTISDMEKDLIWALEFEKGHNVTIEPFWVVRTLLTRLMVERRSFVQVVNIALETWRKEEKSRWSTLEEVRSLVEAPFANPMGASPPGPRDKGKGPAALGTNKNYLKESVQSSSS